MHIHLTGNMWLNSDEYQYWITSETTRKKNGEVIPVKKIITGYHGTNKGDSLAIENCLNDALERIVRGSELEGDISALANLIRKTRRDIHKWVNIIEEQLGGNK